MGWGKKDLGVGVGKRPAVFSGGGRLGVAGGYGVSEYRSRATASRLNLDE